MPDFSTLSRDEMRLWSWLQTHALGRARAVVIPQVAAALAWSVRRVQQVAAVMRKGGWPVVTARQAGEGPVGMFLATSQEDIDRYLATLTAVARDVEEQIRAGREMLPVGTAGPRTLFD